MCVLAYAFYRISQIGFVSKKVERKESKRHPERVGERRRADGVHFLNFLLSAFPSPSVPNTPSFVLTLPSLALFHYFTQSALFFFFLPFTFR